MSNKGVFSIKDNVYIPMQNRARNVDEHICGMCQEQDATYRCSQCDAYICTDCVGKHLRNLPE